MRRDPKLTNRNLTLPFIITASNNDSNSGGVGSRHGDPLAYPVEIACIISMAELQRKKTAFLRDTPEKLMYISKLYYPLWTAPIEDSCLVVDGLASLTNKFNFKEPTNIESFIEDLKKYSWNLQEFLNTLKKYAGNLTTSTEPSAPFTGLITDAELQAFFIEYLSNDAVFSKNLLVEAALIPLAVNEQAVQETRQTVLNYLRKIDANIKGLKYALENLNDEVEFHKHAASNEIEWLEEKQETESSKLKPEVDEKIKKLTVKHEKTVAATVKSNERKAVVLEKKREKYVRKLQTLEQKREAAKKKIEIINVKNVKIRSKGMRSRVKSTTYLSYELAKREREVNEVKREINAVSNVIENVKKEGDRVIRQIEDEYNSNVLQEEDKLTQLNSFYVSKIGKRKEQINTIASAATAITTNIENIIRELENEAIAFKKEVTIELRRDAAALAHIPIYLVKYAKADQDEERYSLFSPITITENTSILQGLRKMLTRSQDFKLKLLMQPMSKRLHDTLSVALSRKMQSSKAFKEDLNKLCQTNNLLAQANLEATLSEGLEVITKKGWITSEEAAAIFENIKSENRNVNTSGGENAGNVW